MALNLRGITVPGIVAQGLLASEQEETFEDQLQEFTKTTRATVVGDAIDNKLANFNPVVASFQEEQDQTFFQNAPNILFICEYVVSEKNIGVLIVFEKYSNATHYELFKKNKFNNSPKFERILFLTSEALYEETVRLAPYIKDIVGFNLDENLINIVFDDNIKKDRIYEYNVRASFVPRSTSEINYSAIMRSKSLVKTIEVSADKTVFDLSASFFNYHMYAWILALLNPQIPYFGNSAVTTKISDIQKIIFVPKKLGDVMRVIQDSIYLFGLKAAVSHIVYVLGAIVDGGFRKQYGILNEDITQAFLDSIDENAGVFSVDFFKKTMQEKSNIFSFFLGITSDPRDTPRKKIFEDAGVSIPDVSGVISFNDLVNFSAILQYVRKVDYAITYTQDNLQQINAK